MPHIDIHETELSNGLRIVVCPDNSAPVLTVQVTYHVGSFNEDPNRTGLAHLFEHLMFDNVTEGGSKTYDLMCAKAGGTNNAYTIYDHTAYHISLPKHQLDVGLWLEAERMRSFQISEHALTTQRNVVLEEIKQQVMNQPYARWMFATDEAAYTKDCHYNWHVYGEVDHVANTSMDDARSFFERYYAPDNAVLCVAGDCDPDDVFMRAEREFGSIPRAPKPPSRPEFKPEQRVFGTHVVEKDSVPTAATFMSVHLPGQCDDEILVADLANSFIGVGKASILYRELVKRQHLATHAASFIDRRAHGSLLTMIVYAIDESTTPDALAEAAEKALKGAIVSQEDMRRIVNRQRTALAMELQRTDGVADSVAFYKTFKGDAGEVNRLLDKYSQIQLVDVQEMVNRIARRQEWVRVDIVPNTWGN